MKICISASRNPCHFSAGQCKIKRVGSNKNAACRSPHDFKKMPCEDGLVETGQVNLAWGVFDCTAKFGLSLHPRETD